MGTWVDGKPIYEKTFQKTVNAVKGRNDINLIGSGVVDHLIDQSGYFTSISTVTETNIPVYFDGLYWVFVWLCPKTANGFNRGSVWIYLDMGSAETVDFVVTIRYTKV